MATPSAKSRMERILRLQEQIDEIKADIRDIYAEEKADGGDKTAMGAAISYIRKRAKDKNAFDKREALAAVYINAFEASGTPVATHTHAPDVNLSYSQSGLSYAEEKGRGVDSQSQPVPADQHVAATAAQDDVGATASSTYSAHKPAGDLAADKGDKGRGSFPAGGPAHSNSTAVPSAQSDSAGEVPSSPASPTTHSDDDFEPSRLSFLRKSAADYRPYCQKPEACGASGLKHCYTCQKSIDLAEMAEHARVSV